MARFGSPNHLSLVFGHGRQNLDKCKKYFGQNVYAELWLVVVAVDCESLRVSDLSGRAKLV